MAMPATGPIPGSAPMSVPAKTPIVTKTRLTGLSATAKPVARLLSRSKARPASLKAEDAFRQWHPQPDGEDYMQGDSGADRGRQEYGRPAHPEPPADHAEI